MFCFCFCFCFCVAPPQQLCQFDGDDADTITVIDSDTFQVPVSGSSQVQLLQACADTQAFRFNHCTVVDVVPGAAAVQRPHTANIGYYSSTTSASGLSACEDDCLQDMQSCQGVVRTSFTRCR